MYVAVPGGPGVVRVAGEPGSGGRDRSGGRSGAVAGAALLALAGRRRCSRSLAGRSDRPAAHRDRRRRRGPSPRARRPGSPARASPTSTRWCRRCAQMHQQLGDRFDELRREQAESAALVESMVEGVIAADARGRIVTANPAARRLLGYDADRAAARPPRAVPGQGRRARWWTPCSRASRCRTGSSRWTAAPCLAERARRCPPAARCWCCTTSPRCGGSRRSAATSSPTSSHELKTPLTSISGYAETLLADRPDAETTRAVPRDHPEQRAADAAAGGRPARPVAHRVGALAAGAGPVDVAAVRAGVWAALGERAAAPRGAASTSSVGARRRSGLRRSRRAAAGPHQPARQFAPLHAGRGARSPAAAGATDGGVAVSVRDNGQRHRARAPAPDLRAVLPGRPVPLARRRRHRARARDREAPGRGARRPGHGGERAGRGHHRYLLVSRLGAASQCGARPVNRRRWSGLRT